MAKQQKYDNNGKVSLWERVNSQNGNVFYSGQLTIDDITYDIVLNENMTENPKAPKFYGSVKEKQ